MGNKFVNTITKIAVIIAIIFGSILILSVYISSLGNTDNNDRNQKYEEEIKYLDTKILTLLNYLNNIDLQNYRIVLTKVEAESDSASSSEKKEQGSSQTQDSQDNGTDKEETTITKMEEDTIVQENAEIDWKTIKGELEILSSTWATVALDLYKIDVSSDDIIDFSNNLDQAILSAQKQDKNMSAMYMAKIYSYLPRFLNKVQADVIKKETLQAKSYILNAYAYVQTDNWERVEEETDKARNLFASLVNDANLIENPKKYNINKAYIVIEELKNSLSTREKGIFYVKYKNSLEQLNILS